MVRNFIIYSMKENIRFLLFLWDFFKFYAICISVYFFLQTYKNGILPFKICNGILSDYDFYMFYIKNRIRYNAKKEKKGYLVRKSKMTKKLERNEKNEKTKSYYLRTKK